MFIRLFACRVILFLFFFTNLQTISVFNQFFLLIYNLIVKQFGSQMRPHKMWGLIQILIVCKGHQGSSKFAASGQEYINPSELNNKFQLSHESRHGNTFLARDRFCALFIIHVNILDQDKTPHYIAKTIPMNDHNMEFG